MTTRRHFLKALASVPPAYSLRSLASGGDPSRIALVIGNSSYRIAPLDNPGNDARAMTGLFQSAGFTVDSHLDCTRIDMVAAIERFGAVIRRAETKQAMFYYAGHGVQLDWRNYLLPVDAKVDTAEQLRQHCIDLNVLLRELDGAKDKTFVIILDACRDNPFGTAYRPEQKGLAQFDAPPGSLIAYATAPGRGASDGVGKNGLYTGSLVRELSVRSARIEDALKRVRLNVRLSSGGAQVPWETTSLESDVFLFSTGHKKLTDAELEKQLEADLAGWAGIKSSRRIDDWVGYLRSFPSGRFAEIAQMRLARLLEEEEKQKEKERLALVQAAAAAPAPAPIATAPAIDLKPGGAVPQFLKPSANPYSAGTYPLGRRFTVGDEAVFQESDAFSGVVVRRRKLRVTRVDFDADRVEINEGKAVVDLMGNPLKSEDREFDVPQQIAPAELQIGKKWSAAFTMVGDGQSWIVDLNLQIVARERVRVPAGDFDAFKIIARGWNMTNSDRHERTIWVVPGLNFSVKREQVIRNQKGSFKKTERYELVALRQQVFSL